MRILLSCLQSLKRHSIPAYGYWRTYFVEGLREAGHDVLEVPGVDWAEGLTYPAGPDLDSWRARTWEATDAFARLQHERKPVDLFLGYLFPRQVDVAAIAELQRIGIPCVNFFCDNVREFVTAPAGYRPFVLHWVPEMEALPMYRAAGLKTVFAPMPCWIPPELRSLPGQETEPATFAGSADIVRRDLLGRALQCGADFAIRGPDWRAEAGSIDTPGQASATGNIIANQIALVRQFGLGGLTTKLSSRFYPLRPPAIPESRTGPALPHDEYLRVTREARVTIGVNRVATATHSPRRPLIYSRLRDIEAPMLGACYLTEWASGLETLYEPGVEIETYRTAEELAAKLGELLRDGERRKTMRAKAQHRALSEHSVGESIRRVIGQI